MADAPIAPVARIAMWSGPRNVSTALMRSFEARGDCAVTDEPLYAYYLDRTGKPHPGREAVLASQPRSWREVVSTLLGPAPGGSRIWYQKHMAHHLLPEVELDWLGPLRHAFLIRDPAEMLASLLRVLPDPRLEDTGLPQQVALLERLEAAGQDPPVVDARELLDAPGAMLAALCARLGIEYRDSMLRWPAGRRDSDGVWAPHWYASVERSTGFEPWSTRDVSIPADLEPLLEDARALHARLARRRLRLDP